MGRSEVSTSVVKWIEGLCGTMSIVIRRYIDQIRFAVYMAVSFITFFSYSFGSILYHSIYGCMFCMLLFNFVNHVFLLLCMLRSGYFVSLCCSVYCLCVYCTTAMGCQANCSEQMYRQIISCLAAWSARQAPREVHGPVRKLSRVPGRNTVTVITTWHELGTASSQHVPFKCSTHPLMYNGVEPFLWSWQFLRNSRNFPAL